MKTAAIILAATALFLCAAQAQWNGGACDRPVNVTVNRYNYYAPSACAPAYSGWNGCAPWGYNGYGQPVPNGLGWTPLRLPSRRRALCSASTSRLDSLSCLPKPRTHHHPAIKP